MVLGLVQDGVVVGDDGGIKCVKCAIEHVWNLPGVAARLGLSESMMREKLARYTQNTTVLNPEVSCF